MNKFFIYLIILMSEENREEPQMKDQIDEADEIEKQRLLSKLQRQ